MSLRPLLCAAIITAASVTLIAPSATPGLIQVTGNQLRSALPPASFFGRGYTVQKGYSSGNSLEHYPADLHPASMSCVNAWSMYSQTGFGETAYTSDLSISTQAQAYQLSIYQLANSHNASAVLSAMRTRSATCRSYSLPPVKGDTQHVSQSVSTTHTGGHEAFLISQSTTFSDVSGSLHTFVLVTIDGADLLVVQTVDPLSNSIPNNPSPAAVTLYMIRKVSALR